MIKLYNLFGYLPNMLELSMNDCKQGCEYCYAKTWKRETSPIDKVVNDILRKEATKEGLLPFLIRKRSPITLSNRTDIMSSPDWRERLYALKKLGFPLYLETKLNKDYKDLAEILDKKTDAIYQTVTGRNNKYEEHNHLSADEKLEASKWFNENGFHHSLALNPYMPDKVTTDEIKYMLDYAKPHGFVMRDYHTTSKTIHRHLYREEYPKDIMELGRAEIRKYCREKGILHDIDGWEDNPYPELNLRHDMNESIWGGNSIVLQDFLIYIDEQLKRTGAEVIDVTFDDFLWFYEKQIKYFDGCIYKKSDYAPTAGKSNRKLEKDRFDIVYFLKGMWNWGKMYSIMDYYKDKFDKDGNIIYFRHKDGFWKFIRDDLKEISKGKI